VAWTAQYVNLATSRVQAVFTVAGDTDGEATRDNRSVAEAYTTYPPVVQAPKPELQSLTAYLQAFAR
jgi:hypothetical protein